MPVIDTHLIIHLQSIKHIKIQGDNDQNTLLSHIKSVLVSVCIYIYEQSRDLICLKLER